MKNLTKILLIGLMSLSLSPLAWSDPFLEEVIDFIGGTSTLGLSLRQREAEEARLRAELDRELSAKLREISEESRRFRHKELTVQIYDLKGRIRALEAVKSAVDDAYSYSVLMARAFEDRIHGEEKARKDYSELKLYLESEPELRASIMNFIFELERNAEMNPSDPQAQQKIMEIIDKIKRVRTIYQVDTAWIAKAVASLPSLENSQMILGKLERSIRQIRGLRTQVNGFIDELKLMIESKKHAIDALG